MADPGAAAAAAAGHLGRRPGLRDAQGRASSSTTRRTRSTAGIHYMTADTVEECWQLLRQSLTTAAYPALAHVPEYSAWLRKADWVPAYERYRRNLQLIGLNDAGQAVGAEEPEPPRRARRADDGVPRRARRADAPRPGRRASRPPARWRRPRRRAGRRSSPGEQLGADVLEHAVDRGAGLRRGAVALRRGAVRRRGVRRPGRPTRSASCGGSTDGATCRGTTPSRRPCAAEHAASRSGPRAPRHEYALADYGLTEDQVRAAF